MFRDEFTFFEKTSFYLIRFQKRTPSRLERKHHDVLCSTVEADQRSFWLEFDKNSAEKSRDAFLQICNGVDNP